MKVSWSTVIPLAAAACLVALFTIATTTAQDDNGKGRLIQIAPDNPAKDPLQEDLEILPEDQLNPSNRRLFLLPGDPADLARQARPASKYYIGVAAGKVDDALRAHLDLPEGVGLIVGHVSLDTPAAEAGIQQHDILIRADGNELRELDDLIAVVEEHGGENPNQFAMDIIRHGQPETVWVTPAERPDSPPAIQQPGFNEGFPELGAEERRMLERLLERSRRGGGIDLGGVRPRILEDFDLPDLPEVGHVSVTVTREAGGPTKVTVQRDGETWVIEGDDPEALQQLPEDLRPMVERMLSGEQAWALPNLQTEMQQRMQQMEEEMRKLRERLREQFDDK